LPDKEMQNFNLDGASYSNLSIDNNDDHENIDSHTALLQQTDEEPVHILSETAKDQKRVKRL
jgi:hypothetical protein